MEEERLLPKVIRLISDQQSEAWTFQYLQSPFEAFRWCPGRSAYSPGGTSRGCRGRDPPSFHALCRLPLGSCGGFFT